jgi:hypothetical protein
MEVPMSNQMRSRPSPTARLASSITVVGVTLVGLLLVATGAYARPIPLGGLNERRQISLSRGADGPMFGPLGVYITTADKAEPFMAPNRGAYRVDIPMMTSSSPIKYKTMFKAPGGVDLAGMKAAGIQLVLTVRNGTSNSDLPLPDDGSRDAAFQAAVGAMIDQLEPGYIVYGNEVNDQGKYSGTVAQFQRIMALGHAVASAKGVPDGGSALMGSVTAQATYGDILSTQGQAAATTFKTAAQMGAYDKPLADEANAFIDATKAADVDFFVWHSYFANPSAILSIKSYLERRFGGPSFVNELGWRTGTADTGVAIIDALEDTSIPIVLIYGSGLGPNGPDKLWNLDGTPTAEGGVISAHLLGL